MVADLGRRFYVNETAIKTFSVGYPIQAPLDALSNLLARHQVNPADIEHIDVTIDERGAYTVNRRRMTSINIQHLMAIMLIDGDITFASSHDETRARDPAVARLKKRIRLSGSAQLSRAKTTQAVVEITTRSHRRLRYHTRAVRGTATNPMSRDEVAAKSRGLLTPLLGTRRAERLIETVWNIERVSDVRRLRPLLHAD
jgi:2-methylcitrate dehydratase PrpD